MHVVLKDTPLANLRPVVDTDVGAQDHTGPKLRPFPDETTRPDMGLWIDMGLRIDKGGGMDARWRRFEDLPFKKIADNAKAHRRVVHFHPGLLWPRFTRLANRDQDDAGRTLAEVPLIFAAG